jgi:hypothetical protein
MGIPPEFRCGGPVFAQQHASKDLGDVIHMDRQRMASLNGKVMAFPRAGSVMMFT